MVDGSFPMEFPCLSSSGKGETEGDEGPSSPLSERRGYTLANSRLYRVPEGLSIATMGFDENVWGSEDEEDFGDRSGPRTASDLDREWQARQNQFHTLGYRDGVEAGKQFSVQEGFNVGYAEATIAGYNWGVARGITGFNAFATLPTLLKEKLLNDGDAIGRWEKLNSSISSYSSEDALRSYYRNSIKPLEPHLVASEAALGLSNQAEDERPLSVSLEEALNLSTHKPDARSISAPREEGAEESIANAKFVPMSEMNRRPEGEIEGNLQPGGSNAIDQLLVRVHSLDNASSSGNESGRSDKNPELPSSSSSFRRVSLSMPDGTSIRKISKEDLLSLEESIKNEQILEDHEEIAPLTVPSTPVSTELEELQKKVQSELELASIKLSKIVPAA